MLILCAGLRLRWWRRCGCAAALCLGLGAPIEGNGAPKVEDKSAGDDLFAGGLVSSLGLQIPPGGIQVLSEYHPVFRQPRSERLYVLFEGWNKQFLRRHCESTKGNLYDGGSGGDITKMLKVDCGENPQDRSDLKELVAAAREASLSNRLARLQRVLDVEKFRTFSALEILLVHWDGYCAGGPNNYRVFHDAARDKIVFMPHGMDQLFGVSSSIDFSVTPNWHGLVARGLFSIPQERRRLQERLATLLTNEFRVANLL